MCTAWKDDEEDECQCPQDENYLCHHRNDPKHALLIGDKEATVESDDAHLDAAVCQHHEYLKGKLDLRV